eukprot:Nitzschia sp. Nitz4//scaffold55_size114948//99938//101840//NITZ4_003924-RA/size114948-snap-gene-0.193-mRNA-1//-1//CDS//3329554599//1197//frame0
MASVVVASPLPPRQSRKRTLAASFDHSFDHIPGNYAGRFPRSRAMDDSKWTFLDSDGDRLSDRRPLVTSLPLLLESRQRQGIKSTSRSLWQQQAVQTFVKKPEGSAPRRPWREYARRSLPFTRLGTPASDAVLAMDRQGAFVLALGGQTSTSAPVALALRFYGVPSPSAAGSSKTLKQGSTPLLQTVPLLYQLHEENATGDTDYTLSGRSVTPSTTLVHMLLSKDWRMGVALFCPSNAWREDGKVGSLVLFSVSKRQSAYSTIWQCTNVRVGTKWALTMRNRLWLVEGVPTVTSQQRRIESLFQRPGYLFINDEEDGFRLTWVLNKDWYQEGDPTLSIPSHSAIPYAKHASGILSVESTWERLDVHPTSAERLFVEHQPPKGMAVSCEAFLHLEVLLLSLLSRRKGLASSDSPEYMYNLVSVLQQGRVAEIVIAFLRGNGRGALGVFLHVDMWTGSYAELDWVRKADLPEEELDLRRWCNTLSLNRRMKCMHFGPFAASSVSNMDWTRLCQEREIDLDFADDTDPSVWKEYVKGGGQLSKRPPKVTTLASLYPHCDYVSNKAIVNCAPVKWIRSRDSPVDLVYN